ncbi:uncharacterized protein LOC106666587 [Cimex lectularius]|uniref:CYTH domain-containing protein n=1 Tax=Cimex lectularius TaxID=79782 RepID=A0A8I6TEE7_CIMLE|nr:uncharacterized protein LOC106666587 [Cimex lectularius]
MARNVEIKARLKNLDVLEKVALLAGNEGKVFPQVDHYFNSPNGRLKLRFSGESSSELVFYNRSDSVGPKLSKYNKIFIDDGSAMLQLLTNALGKRGVVSKKRHLFMIGNTRVHIDDVDNLGNFIEFEVILKDDQTMDSGVQVAEQLMEELNIEKENLISCSYIDLCTNL